MTVDGNKVVARRLYEEVVSDGRLDLLEELATDDMVDHAAIDIMGLGPGRKAFATHIKAVRKAIPDAKAVVSEMIGENDHVVIYWTLFGTHAGPFFGVDGTDRQLEIPAISRMRFENGRIAEYQVLPDWCTTWQQMGVETP